MIYTINNSKSESLGKYFNTFEKDWFPSYRDVAIQQGKD